MGIGEAEIAIPPLAFALKDAEAPVRVAACEALTPLITEAFTQRRRRGDSRSGHGLDRFVERSGGGGKDRRREASEYVVREACDRQTAVHIAVLELLASTIWYKWC